MSRIRDLLGRVGLWIYFFARWAGQPAKVSAVTDPNHIYSGRVKEFTLLFCDYNCAISVKFDDRWWTIMDPRKHQQVHISTEFGQGRFIWTPIQPSPKGDFHACADW